MSAKTFEEWYAESAFDYAANPIGSRDCGLQRAAWTASRAALLADQKKAPSDVSQAEWDELRGLVMVEHEHCESRNECAICDESLVSSAVKEIKRHRALLADRPDVAGMVERGTELLDLKYQHHTIHVPAVINRLLAALESLAAQNAALRERLEVSDDHGYDGISCRDETIGMQDKEIAKLKAHAEAMYSALSNLLAVVNGECPSLIEDTHHEEKVISSLDAYRAYTGGKP
jgi:hypothetical protein